MRDLIRFVLCVLFAATSAVAADISPAPLPAAEAAKHMTLPPGFSATLFAGEPDVVQPIAFTFDDRGRLWVAEGLTYPNWNFDAKADTKGKDRIVIFEDADGDGRFDKRTVFKDDLVNLSGLELGFGGVYVCSSPNLLFIPVHPGEDKPAGPPRVLLDGWNVRQAQHNVFNGLTWGPDGWLYGLNGIQSKSAVGAPGTPNDKRIQFDCGVWRYHPVRGVFEVVCTGTTNPWGLDFDEFGQGFITNCVIKHLFHVIPGAHFQRMYGQDYAPNVYANMESCADHAHFVGAWTDVRSGPNKNLDAGGGHAHVGAMVYLGDNWPDRYRGSLFTCNLHGNRVNADRLEPAGSGYAARHADDVLLANDPWFRGITIKYGPDGGVYVSDWTDTGECHNAKVVDRDNGRIYKVTFGTPKPAKIDIAALGDGDLVQLLLHKNNWFAQRARRLLQERAAGGKLSPDATAALAKLLNDDPDPRHKLSALWSLHATGGMRPAQLVELLDQPEPYVRGWAIRLATETGPPPAGLVEKLTALATSDPSPVVRLHLASALGRLPAADRWGIAGGLVAHAEDAADQNLPLMAWYGVEPLAAADPARALGLLAKAKLPLVREYLARRLAAESKPGALEPLAVLLADTDDAAIQLDVLKGIQSALGGRRRADLPRSWPAAYAKLGRSPTAGVRDAATAIALTFGDPAAFAALRATAADAKAPPAARAAAVQSLVGAKDAQLVPLLHGLLSDPAARGPALRGLAAAGDEATPRLVLARYAEFTPAERQDAVQTLASRPAFAAALLDAVEAGRVPKGDLSAAVVRQLANYDDAALKKKLETAWGTVRPPDKDKKAAIARYKAQFKPDVLAAADPASGRAVFTRACAACHTLFDAGGKVGPNLTGSQRANLDYVLENIVDPSAAVAKEFQMAIVDTTDGRTINGIVVGETDQAVTIRTTNEDVVVPKAEIAKRRLSPYSMMPEGLLDGLKPEEARDLIGYLASPRQVEAK